MITIMNMLYDAKYLDNLILFSSWYFKIFVLIKPEYFEEYIFFQVIVDIINFPEIEFLNFIINKFVILVPSGSIRDSNHNRY